MRAPTVNPATTRQRPPCLIPGIIRLKTAADVITPAEKPIMESNTRMDTRLKISKIAAPNAVASEAMRLAKNASNIV